MPRSLIQQLPQSLVNRIAAGEVIERPASVVKELVDNAIDAGATQITVEIEDGGRELIRVLDDGCGIPPEELALAFAPHATSKLRTDEDLFRIATMGFRGEALASIGSVSQARVLSRTADSDAAYEIFNRGGDITDPQATAGNVGTTIDIRHLFFNVPARRKFLKGTQTEFGHIADMLLRLALPQPDIAFRLLHNGRVVREYPATALEQRLLCAWPSEYHDRRIGLRTRDAELRVSGTIGLPELAAQTPKYQHLYVNRRPIRDKFIQHALREAYRGLTEPGRHPAAILLIDIPPGDVDVNVHPTKSEVRFRDSGRLHGLVMSAVREALLGHDLTPRAVPRVSEAMPESQRQSLQEQLASFFKTPALATPASPGPAFELTRSEASAAWLPLSSPPRPAETDHAPAAAADPAFARDAMTAAPTVPATAATPATPAVPSAMPASLKAIQLHNSYLVVESDEGMLVIDQHALHERILYEDLLARLMRGSLESQRMLIPITLRASERQVALLEQIKPLLARLGMEVEPFGPDTIAISAFPSFLDRLEPSLFVQELLEKGEQELLDLHEEELLHGVLDMMACKAAVKAGDPLTPGEIDALLARRELADRTSNCPHGRPTTLRLSLRDLEKQFKRTGF